MRNPYWTCTRVTEKVKCGFQNPRRAKKCQKCGKLRPAVRQSEHLVALKRPYEDYVALNGGDQCGICGALPKPNRKLDRDHDHTTMQPRGLLCPPCNRYLVAWRYGLQITPEWLRAAAAYLERAREAA